VLKTAWGELIDQQGLDTLLNRVDQRGLQLTGEAGFLQALLKAVLKRGLRAELSDHLGYEKGDRIGPLTIATATRLRRCKPKGGPVVWPCPRS
jgi:hypothetical protein